MKRQCFLLVLITAIMGLCVCSCSKDNDEEDKNTFVLENHLHLLAPDEAHIVQSFVYLS